MKRFTRLQLLWVASLAMSAACGPADERDSLGTKKQEICGDTCDPYEDPYPPAPYCGDGVCNGGDSACNCPKDCPSADKDLDGLNDGTEETLAQRFSPVFAFDSGEQFLPANVGWYLARTRLRMHYNGNCPDDQVINTGDITSQSLVKQSRPYKTDPWPFCDQTSTWAYSGKPNNFSDDHFFLEIDTPDNDLTRKGDPSTNSWQCYAHVSKSTIVDGSFDGYDVQYWIFMPYNGVWGGEHEGDWEHITVRVNSDQMTIRSVYFAAHAEGGDDGTVLQSWQLTKVGPQTVKAFVANATHAVYGSDGWRYRSPLPNDYFDGLGVQLDCRGTHTYTMPIFNLTRTINRTVHVGDLACPTAGNEWLLYGGRWGEIGMFDVTSGPPGPARQTWWDPSMQK